MFALSRWSGGLVAAIGPRLPLTAGPIIAAVGLALLALAGVEGGRYWTTLFPAVVVLGFGMAITVAPLTTTVMSAVPSDHAGVASGINNTVSRVAGLLAIAVFGVVLTRRFESRMRPELQRAWVTPAVRSQLQSELSKMAGARIDSISIDPAHRAELRAAVKTAFVSGYRVVVLEAAVLALAAAAFGAGINSRPNSARNSTEK